MALFDSYDTKVSLTILNGHLAAAGTLLCDPVAKVFLVQQRSVSNERTTKHATPLAASHTAATTAVSMNVRQVAETKPRIFTAHPSFDEVLNFTVPSLPQQQQANGGSSGGEVATSHTYLVINMEDSQGKFYGQAVCPFALSTPSRGAERLMLLPRGTVAVRSGGAEDPSYQEDLRTLDQFLLDDFGFVNIQWNVAAVPRGGMRGLQQALAQPPKRQYTETVLGQPVPQQQSQQVTVVVKALWVPSVAAEVTPLSAADSSAAAAAPVAQRSISVDFSCASEQSFAFERDAGAVWTHPHAVTTSSNATTTTTAAAPASLSRPMFITLSLPNAARLDAVPLAGETITFTCTSQLGRHGVSTVSRATFPLVPFIGELLDRDCYWSTPLHSSASALQFHSASSNEGVLLVSLRLLSRPLDANAPVCPEGATCSRVNQPLHQAQAKHPTNDWGRRMPQCPAGAFQPVHWESQHHIARATERRWRKECVRAARPTADHVRHMFEALLGRVSLDPNIAQLTATFHNKPVSSVAAVDLRAVLIAVAFHAVDLSPNEAARFAFVAMRKESPYAIALDDVVFIWEHSLLEATVELPSSEIERRVRELFGTSSSTSAVSLDEFTTLWLQSPAVWFELGVLTQQPTQQSTASLHALSADAMASANAGGSLHNTSATAQANPTTTTNGTAAPQQPQQVWRTFTVRVLKTGRPFSVTAHASDLISDVMAMVEPNAGVPASRQIWIYQGVAIDSRKTVQDALPVAPSGEITVQEKEEAITLTFVHREKGKKWEQKFLQSDKVLKLRAMVQQKTMIPLTRCVMTSCGHTMQDRHALSYYKLVDGSVVEVSHQQ